MSMVNNIGGATLSAAVVAEKSVELKKTVSSSDSTSSDLNASVATYFSLPGFNAPSPLQTDNSVSNADRANAVVKAVAESNDDGLKLALKQFDDGLKKLAERPETQIFRATFGLDGADANAPAPLRVPGVGEDGLLGKVSKEEFAADTNKDGKISEDERRRYQLPITYRVSAHAAESLVDGPSAFSLTEANRAYGVVATAEAA
ncbi:hypothetical protein GW587_18920 [Duganella sp. SAP-35]|uniref:EF-hand domain-containing protein n=2 Tax=Duganella aceris TaxID=2703883 RepID=A0ABX0FNX1_9BURK|nr:hypothetical protein [Duganella aceris]